MIDYEPRRQFMQRKRLRHMLTKLLEQICRVEENQKVREW